MCAATLPWFAVFSGVYGLYFFIVLSATALASWLFLPVLVLAAPLAALLLLVMPAGALRAAFGCPPGGVFGWFTRGGCVVSMFFAAVYGVLMVVIGIVPEFADGADVSLDFSLLWRAVVLAAGFWFTWRGWLWLRCQARR